MCRGRGQSCRVWYDIGGRQDIMSAGEIVICKFIERSEVHVGVGAPSGFVIYGMMQCRFNKANKIVSAEMVFDVMNCMQQYQVLTVSLHCSRYNAHTSIVLSHQSIRYWHKNATIMHDSTLIVVYNLLAACDPRHLGD